MARVVGVRLPESTRSSHVKLTGNPPPEGPRYPHRSGGTAAGQPRKPSGLALPGAAVTRDDQTGQSYLKLPLPEPETLQKLAEVFAALTKGK